MSKKEALKDLELVAKQEKEKEKRERKVFNEQLKHLPDELNELEKSIRTLSEKLAIKLQQRDVLYEDIEGLLRDVEARKMRIQSLVVMRPVRYKPTENQRKRIHDFEKQREQIQKTTLAASDAVSQQAVSRLQERELLREFANRSNQYTVALSDLFSDAESRLDKLLRSLRAALAEERTNVTENFHQQVLALTPTVGDVHLVSEAMQRVLAGYEIAREAVSRRLDPFLDHLSKLTLDINEDNLVGYYKIRYEDIEAEWEQTRELAQLGIAVEIIDHQFNVLYSQLATTIQTIANDLNSEPQSRRHYQQLTNAFEHLESNYKLLQPLYRTTSRVRRPIKGQELFDYAEQFFSQQLEDQHIQFTITSSASVLEFFSYDSVIKPVIVNIINNAIYWMRPVESRRIQIDSIGQRLLIQNSGLPIDDYLLDDIFNLFYSKRPNGRGIGLYLARTSLNGIGYSLYATNNSELNSLGGACFVIEPMNQ